MTTAFENSFKSRLRNIAREKRLDPSQLWQNLVLERFLVRLSHSNHSSHFILKGGVLLAHYVELNRHTQDLDFLVQRLSNEVETLEKVLTDVIKVSVDDGFRFTDLKVNDLPHPHMKYPGMRVKHAIIIWQDAIPSECRPWVWRCGHTYCHDNPSNPWKQGCTSGK